MVTLVIVLNKEDYLEDILSTLVEYKVRGATIIDSQGMASAIVSGNVRSIPFFGSLRNFINEKHPYNKTIFSVVNEDLIDDIVKAIRNLFDKLEPGNGFMFTMPVNNIYLLDK